MKISVPNTRPEYKKEHMPDLLQMFLSEEQQKGDWMANLKYILDDKKKKGNLKLPNIIAH